MKNSIDTLNTIAANNPHGDMRMHQVLHSDSGYAVQWQMTWNETSWLRFVNRGGWRDTLEEAIAAELGELEERMTMNIYGTELFPYIQGEMLKDSGRIAMTITNVKEEDVTNNRGSSRKPVVFFKEKKKGLILNKTNARAIARLYGKETDDWQGKRIYIYAESGEWFGKFGYTVRVAEEVPANGNGNGRKAEPAHPPDDFFANAGTEKLFHELSDHEKSVMLALWESELPESQEHDELAESQDTPEVNL